MKNRTIFFSSAKSVLPERYLRFQVDLEQRIADHDMVWGKPHGPPASWKEGAPVGNGDFGALIYGYPDNLSFVLGKTDSWDRSAKNSAFYGESFEDVRKIYLENDKEAFEKLTGSAKRMAEKHPGKQHAATFGMFRLSLCEGALAVAPVLRLSLWDGTARLIFKPVGADFGFATRGEIAMEMFVSRKYRVMVARITPAENTSSASLLEPGKFPRDRIKWSLSRPDHAPHPSAQAGKKNGVSYLCHDFLPKDRYVSAFLSDAEEEKTVSLGNTIFGEERNAGAESLTIFLTLVSSNDAKDPVAEACTRLEEARRAGYAKIVKEHKKWWKDYWDRAYVCVGDQRLEKWWYTSLYLAGSITEPGCQSPGLQGVWIKENAPAWEGDYHSNVNLQSVYWGLYGANRVDHIEPFVRHLAGIAAQCRRDTAGYFRMRGIRFPHASGIDGYELTGGQYALNLGVSVGGSSWLTQLLWQVYEYTGDKNYLKKVAYPLLKEVALFYEDYLMWDEKGKRWVLEPSVHFEVLCPGFEACGKNSLYELSLVYGAFQRAIAAAKELKIDQTTQKRWAKTRAHLSDLPADPNGGGWFGFEGRDTRNFGGHIFKIPPVFPGELVSIWHGPDKWRKQARATLSNPLPAKDLTGNSWCGGQGIRELIRMGPTYADRVFEAARWPERDSTTMMPYGNNGLNQRWDTAYLQADHGPGMCSVLNDMLVLGLDGVIRILPCFPAKIPASFHSLRAPGAFLISAEKRGREVDYVVIQSLAGNKLCLGNPWGRKEACIREAVTNRILLQSKAEILQVPTRKRQVLIIENKKKPYAHIWKIRMDLNVLERGDGDKLAVKEAILVDLKPYANRGFSNEAVGHEKIGWPDEGNNDLRSIVPALLMCHKIPFVIIDPAANSGASVVALKGGKTFLTGPQAVKGIKVNARVEYLYFLHALTYGGNESGSQAGSYVVRFENNCQEEIKIINGQSITDWYNIQELPFARVAIKVYNQFKKGKVALYMTKWKNLSPAEKIVSIDFVKSDHLSTPILIAVTGKRITV